MTKTDAARQLEDLAREVDLVVYRLEVESRRRAEAASVDPAMEGVRRDLERLKDHLADLARALDT